MNDAMQSYYAGLAPFNRPVEEPAYYTYYIDPNQFAADEIGDRASDTAGVDRELPTQTEAELIARKIAAFSGRDVGIDVWAYDYQGQRMHDWDSDLIVKAR